MSKNERNRKSSLIETIVAFLHKKLAYGGSLLTDGSKLYSYLVVIGEWDGDVVRLHRRSLECSRTITRHCNMLRTIATAQGIQIIEMDQAQRQARETDEAVGHLMKELLKYKPESNEPSSNTTFSNPDIFNIEEWLEENGESVKDNEL